MSGKRAEISDHALVRWLERVGGIDMDYFRQHIAELIGDAIKAGASSATIDGIIYKIDPASRKLMTVYLASESHAPKHARMKNARSRPDWKYSERDELHAAE